MLIRIVRFWRSTQDVLILFSSGLPLMIRVSFPDTLRGTSVWRNPTSLTADDLIN
jgi:hypothetical protein